MVAAGSPSAAATATAAQAWRWLGRADYAEVLAEQLAARTCVWAGEPGVVLLCEHPPVITLGRSASPAHILDAGGVPVVRVERGGEVTYHGPGQLMVYPVVKLRSVVAFLETVGGAIAQSCAALGVPGARWRRDPAGVWLGERKLAACGIHVARGVSVHGFALNVDTPPDAWRGIRACGLAVAQVSLAGARAELAGAGGAPGGAPDAAVVTVAQVAHELGPRLARALAR